MIKGKIVQGNKRNLQLDILRGIAVLLVIGRHLELERPGGMMGGFAWVWWQIGWLGVDLFFVLSGFLIGGLLISELERNGNIDVKRFLIRRGLKIYPPYFVFIGYLFMMPMLKAIVGSGNPGTVFAEQWHALWPNLLFLQNYIGSNPAGHTWTLAVEEHFYIMLPFAMVGLLAWNRYKLLIPLCIVIVPIVVLGLRCLSVGMDDPFAARMAASHLRLDALLFGVGLRGVAQYLPDQFARARKWKLYLVGAGIAFWSINLFIPPTSPVVRTIGLSFTFLGSASFLLAAYHTHGADFGKWSKYVHPVARGVAWIGVYSYAIYLWHVTAIRILEREIGGRLFQVLGGSNQVSWTLAMILVSAGAIVVGVLASRIVEWPVLRLRDRFFPSRNGSPVPVESPAGAKPETEPDSAPVEAKQSQA